jgi:hypothetical protein
VKGGDIIVKAAEKDGACGGFFFVKIFVGGNE